ncbi:MAG: DUF2163 domain-containing protein [Caulobacteraceae bacterium]|nr:DUF2163 domain-containing protein [Caulobacteraceae bacterium]
MRTPTDATGQAGATVALLNSGADFVMADLYTLTLSGGLVLRWSGAAIPISFNGATWGLGPVLERGKISHKIGVEVSTLDVTVSANAGDLINGVHLIPFVRGNGLDGATFRLDRAFLPDWSSPVTGIVNDFSGRVTSIKNISRSEFELTVSSWTVLLNVNMGPDLFQTQCLNTLYDANCAVSKAALAVSGAVSATGAVSSFNTNLTAADGRYSQGQIVFTSGANAGLSRAVKSYAQVGGVVSLVLPLPYAPAVGDGFTIYPGCDLTMATCSTKFANLANFRGQPFVPTAETIA